MNAKSVDHWWTYCIVVQGRLEESWSSWLGGMSIAVERKDGGVTLTTLTGQVVDQPALRGLLNRLWDLNLTVISVNRVDLER